MRLIFFIFTTCLLINTNAFSCDCSQPSFCDEINDLNYAQGGIVFKGSYLRSDSINSLLTAYEFKIEKLYKGEVVTPSSPLYMGEFYTNTDSTVWLLSGPTDNCHRTLSENTAIFAVTYNYLSPTMDFGYTPSFCRNDYLVIQQDDILSGLIWQNSVEETIGLEELENLILNGCSSTIDEQAIQDDNEIVIFPQPTSDVVHILWDETWEEWDVKLYDLHGTELKQIKNASFRLGQNPEGVYILRFSKGNQSFTKRVLKI